MPQTRKQKESIVADIVSLFKESKILVFSDPTKLEASKNMELRSALRKAGVKYQLVKKTLLKRAMNDAGMGEFEKSDMFKGSVAIMGVPEISVEAVKALSEFGKSVKEKFSILGGWLQDKVLSAHEVNALAMLPEKEILLSQLVGALVSPMRGLAYVLQANIQKLLIVLGRLKTV